MEENVSLKLGSKRLVSYLISRSLSDSQVVTQLVASPHLAASIRQREQELVLGEPA